MSSPEMPGSSPGEETPSGPAALRLIYEYEDGDVRLVSQQRVDVAVSGFDLAEAPSVDHVEVRDVEGTALSRVTVRNALPESLEVFGEPGEAITRVPDTVRRGAFTVVVPAPEAAARVVLQRPAAPEAEPAPGEPGVRGVEPPAPAVLSDDAIEG
ncbi:hypothetical protein R8Z57_16020 [Microbacterium sp. M3]|uniref:Uncharacterized protein n=1 Tax=Microbacterium arthrosphaerae TaxID=792652 RepID=A0ABU4H4M1_9MICO|nr:MULTISPECIES: hypothetical protein [Microbacterium]MDW4574287.1 hypothetical protein [Microbacterium arthrosphaerae]MDW7608142.1 hypothetical protein [Microbacterium sp. M3]